MDLFNDTFTQQELLKDSFLLKGLALTREKVLLDDLQGIINHAPLRYMMTKMGYAMSVAMTNCGSLGWESDRNGYRYSALDPMTSKPWPHMPDSFQNWLI